MSASMALQQQQRQMANVSVVLWRGQPRRQKHRMTARRISFLVEPRTGAQRSRRLGNLPIVTLGGAQDAGEASPVGQQGHVICCNGR